MKGLRLRLVVWLAQVAAVFLLASCSPSTTLLEKPGPQAVDAQSLIHPPWEALVKAGPGAEKDIDLETLNGPQGAASVPAQPPDGAMAASAAGPQPDTAAKPEKAASPAAADKPGTVAIKAVALLPVTGASPQGNRELTAAMRQVLKQAGWPVLDKPRKDALTIQGKVNIAPPEAAGAATQNVRLDWSVASPQGKVLGHVSQANGVPAHSLDASWGQAADYATQAAAEGIFKLINQFR